MKCVRLIRACNGHYMKRMFCFSSLYYGNSYSSAQINVSHRSCLYTFLIYQRIMYLRLKKLSVSKKNWRVFQLCIYYDYDLNRKLQMNVLENGFKPLKIAYLSK